MKHVQQKTTFDCGLACVAIATGNDLDHVTKLAGDSLATRQGCRESLIWILLSHLGIASRVLYQPNCKEWPPKLNRPYIALVNTPMHHWVVVDGNVVYDPAYDTPKKTHDYKIGYTVLELYT